MTSRTPLPPRPTAAEIARDPCALWAWMDSYAGACLLGGLHELREEEKRERGRLRARLRLVTRDE